MVLATCRGRHELIQGACGCAYARLLGMQCTHLRVGKLVYATCNAAPGPWTGREWFITSLQTSRMALSSNLYMPMHHPVVCSGFRGHPLVSWPFPFVHGRLLVITCTHHQTVSDSLQVNERSSRQTRHMAVFCLFLSQRCFLDRKSSPSRSLVIAARVSSMQ